MLWPTGEDPGGPASLIPTSSEVGSDVMAYRSAPTYVRCRLQHQRPTSREVGMNKPQCVCSAVGCSISDPPLAKWVWISNSSPDFGVLLPV